MDDCLFYGPYYNIGLIIKKKECLSFHKFSLLKRLIIFVESARIKQVKVLL